MKLSNDLKLISSPALGNYTLSGMTGSLSTVITVIDMEGNPLVNAHVTWPGGGVVTDANGDASISVPSENTQITISYMGKRTHIAAFKDLVNAMITMQDNINNLPPVVVNPTKPLPGKYIPPKKTTQTNWLTTLGIGLAAFLLLTTLAKQSDKKTNSKGLNAPKPKKKKAGKKPKTKKRKGLREPAPEPAFEITL